MNRRTFVYLFISLTMVSLVFGALPLTAAATSNVACRPDRNTPVPTDTPVPVTDDTCADRHTGADR